MFDVSKHEEIINDLSSLLNVEGVDVAKVSLLIQDLRNNYSEVSTTIAENVAFKTESENSINELRGANNKLLLQLGTQYSQMLNVDKEKLKDDAKGGQTPKDEESETMSLDDIANNFI